MIMGEPQAATGRHGKYSEFADRILNLQPGCEFSVYEDGTPANHLRTRLWAAMRTNDDIQAYLEASGLKLKFRTEEGLMVYVSVVSK